MQQPADLPCNRLASSLVNRTLASLLWQYACLVSNFFFSQFRSSKSIFPMMWASEARLITLLGADSFNLSSRRCVNKKWPAERVRISESGNNWVKEIYFCSNSSGTDPTMEWILLSNSDPFVLLQSQVIWKILIVIFFPQKTYPSELNNYRPVALNSIIMLEESGQENHPPSCLTAPGVTSNSNTSRGGDTDGLSPALSASTLRHRRKLHSTPLHQFQPQFQHYPTASCHQKATTTPSFITINLMDSSLPLQQTTNSKSWQLAVTHHRRRSTRMCTQSIPLHTLHQRSSTGGYPGGVAKDLVD